MSERLIRPLTVSELNRQVRDLLEASFLQVVVTGEISNFSCPSSGHWYFSLKDSKAQVRCAMFRNRTLFMRERPRNGEEVTLQAKVSLYEGRGEFQLIAESMERAGEGALRQAYEALRLKLQSEGLFDAARKRPLPTFPRRIGVITSPTGAAVRDILSVLKRRFPAIPVTLFPVPVQGAEAAPALVAALKAAPRLPDLGVLIVGRGGGSLEDLWAFNEEAVVRAIAACPLPVISAVGHETDFTLADFAADVRAPTPSVAAEKATPDALDWLHRLRLVERRLHQPVSRQLQQQQFRVDDLELRLKRAMQRQLTIQARALLQLSSRLKHPRTRLAELQQRCEQWEQQLVAAIGRYLKLGRRQQLHLEERLSRRGQTLTTTYQTRLSHLVSRLDSVSPLATLARGYSITQNEHGQVITRALQVKPGDILETRLAEGRVRSRVEE